MTTQHYTVFNYTTAAHLPRIRCSNVPVINYHWDSLRAMAATPIENSHNRAGHKRYVAQYSGRHTKSQNWFGVPGGYDQCIRMVDEGWEQGAETMRRMARQLTGDDRLKIRPHMATVRRRKRRARADGMAINMDRVWQGDLDRAWTRMERVEQRARSPKHVTLCIDSATSCGVRAEDAMWRSAAAFAVYEYLTRAGYNVAIYVQSSVGRLLTNDSLGRNVHIVSCRIKDFRTHLSAEHMAAMSHVGFQRSYMFRAKWSLPEAVNYHLGYPLDHDELLPEMARRERDDGALIVRIGNRATSLYGAQEVYNNVRRQFEAAAA